MRWTLTWLLTMVVGFGLMFWAFRWARGQGRRNGRSSGSMVVGDPAAFFLEDSPRLAKFTRKYGVF